MASYKSMLNGFALNTLNKSPNIPDFHLMVGSAETLAPLPVLVYETAKIPNEVIKNMNDMKDKTSEEITKAIAENELEVNDLNWNMATLGSGLGV